MVVRTHAAHFREAYPPRIVNNVYFDTPSLSDYRTHVNGAAVRSKLRLRWYGQPDTVVRKSTLEVKGKRGQVGSKTAYAYGAMPAAEIFDHRRLAVRLREDCDDESLRERLANCTPSLFNRYSRRYFASADNRLRLTIDTALNFQAVRMRGSGARSMFDDRQLIIIELKYAANSAGEDPCSIVSWPFRVGRVSKYVYGIQRLYNLDAQLA
jgi:hypothetical protein